MTISTEQHCPAVPADGGVSASVLIADDDRTNLAILASLLGQQGYTIDTAQSGAETLAKIDAAMPDAILLDVLMPDMDGIEICKRLKDKPETRSIPVIILTAFGDKETRIRCLNAGANDFLTKPIDHAELLIRLKNLLELGTIDRIKKSNEMLKATLEAIENARREWEKTVDCIDDIVMLIDEGNRIVRCNTMLATLTGISCDMLAGERWQEALERSGITASPDHPGTDELFHPSGRWFYYSLSPVKNRMPSDAFAAVVILHDITERKALSDQLHQTQQLERELLEKKNRELETAYRELKAAQSQILQQEKMASIGQLAAGIAHEINNPTGFIMSNLNSLEKYRERLSAFIAAQAEALEQLSAGAPASASALRATIQEHREALKIDHVLSDAECLIKESLEGADRVKKIVQDLKSFSRVDEQEHKMASINEGLESTINIVWNELKYKAVLEKSYGDIPLTRCNPGQMNQVFMNILVNAAHALERQGAIRITTRHRDRSIYITIADSGCGIAPEHLHRIFEPFFTTKEVGKGTGLGLSIAYDIVKKHNGDIRVESTVGTGTVFTIRIPVIDG
ncbi:MAG: response regulator [Nitrospirota bacterium]